MRYWIVLIVLVACQAHAQQTETANVQLAIEHFFEAFHARDTAGLRETVAPGVILQTIGHDKEGKTLVRTEEFEGFLQSIAGIPDTLAFHEGIKEYQIKIDGAMANAWTPYEFRLNETFSHCGVNSFQLVKQDGAWKIIYLIDTRRKEGCL